MDERSKTLLDLGIVMGRTQAFNLVAGRCTAAQAAGMRQIRNEKLYLECSDSWEQFCVEQMGISKSEANKTIHLLDENGPEYFEMAQFTRISGETYRAIAPAIRDGKLHANGEEIELCVENARKIAAAVTEMRRALPKKSARPASRHEQVANLDQLARQLVADFEALSAMERESADWPLFNATLTRTCSALRRIESKSE